MILDPNDTANPKFAILALAIIEKDQATEIEFGNLLDYCETISDDQRSNLLNLPPEERHEAATALAGQIAHGLGCLEECPDLPTCFDGMF